MSSAAPAATRRRLAVPAWCLYDFANSIYAAVIVGTVYQQYYTSQVVGNETGRGDFWWGTVAINVSSILVAVTAPVVGAIADLSGARRKLWVSYTALGVAATASLVLVQRGDVVLGCVLFIVANFAVEGASNFYNSYLPELVARDHIGRVSQWGFAVGYVGSLAGLVMALALLSWNVRVEVIWIVTAVSFAAFALPAFILVGGGGTRSMPVAAAAHHGLRHVKQIFAEVLSHREIRRFLFAYFLYINGVNAAYTFAASFAHTTFGLDSKRSIVLFAVVQISALLGALVMAKPTDVLGSKRVVQLSLMLWCVTCATLILARDLRVFWAGCVVAGLGLGTVQAASRAFMASLIPKGREDELFGFYALCGRTSAPLGATTWGLVAGLTGSQRWAVAALLPFFIAGLIAVSRVRGGGPTTA
jgi:UMF1 family MFS transporter